jgi:hypothetical protein
MKTYPKWDESKIKPLTKAELKFRFGIDEDKPGMLLDDLNDEAIREISRWTDEQKQAAREHLMKTFKQWEEESKRRLRAMRTPNEWRN